MEETGKIYDGTIYGSMDGKTWEILKQETNLTYTNAANTNEQAIANTKSFDIDIDTENPKTVKYVKIKADRTNGNWFTARAFNLFQDTTINPHPTAGIAYSTQEPTNGVVVARLVNPSTEITITSEGGDTHIFRENGEFTFTFVDSEGREGSAKATVTWIDNKGPDIKTECKIDPDDKLLILLDKISEDSYLLDSNNNKTNYIRVNAQGKITSISYLDENEESYKTIDLDENGNITRVVYKNTLDPEDYPSVQKVDYYITNMENGGVTSEEYIFKPETPEGEQTLSSEQEEILRGLRQSTSNPLEYIFKESGNYEFKILDKANNIAYNNIKVDYIEMHYEENGTIKNETKILVSEITYDTTKITKNDVKAIINPYVIETQEVTNEDGTKTEEVVKTENVTMLNERFDEIKVNAKEHTFRDNGNFTFYYKLKEDQNNSFVCRQVAKVSWIDKLAPTADIRYSTTSNTKEPVIASLVNESEEITILNNSTLREHTFTENGEFTFEFEDRAGNRGTATAKVTWIKSDDEEYKKGDINGDGKINIEDLARIKMHLIDKKLLTGKSFRAADVYEDGRINIEDLARIRMHLIGKFVIE